MTNGEWDVIVVGSGAGGGIVASRLAGQGFRILLIEAGGHHQAASFSRWELDASKRLWNPPKFAQTREDGSRPIVMVSGKGVGGSTNINTKVGIRAQEQDYRKWYDAVGLVNESGQPFGAADLDPWFDMVETTMKVRQRTDWTESVRVVERGFNALGRQLHAVTSYTDANCESCGSCTAGCPTNAGSTTQNRYIQPAMVFHQLTVLPDTVVTQVTTAVRNGRKEATGVEVQDAEGVRRTIEAPVVVVAAGALVTPQILQLSGLDRLGTRSSELIGRTLGTHTSRMVQGRYEPIMDAHVVYPITAHCKDFADDADGGFVVEATTLLDPIGLATNLVDENFAPLWGPRLVEAMNSYRHLAGLFMMTNDSNVGTVVATEDLQGQFTVDIPPEDEQRLDEAFAFCTEVHRAAGATEVIPTGYLTSHVQGSVRMGSDPDRSSCDPNQQMWDIDGLYIGDSSVIPRTLTFNPSLTIMALAERLAAHLGEGGSNRLPEARTALSLVNASR